MSSLTPIQKTCLRRDWVAGATGKTLAAKYGVSTCSVYYHCDDLPKNQRKRDRLGDDAIGVVTSSAAHSLIYLKKHQPHFLLWLFAKGKMSQDMMSHMGTRNNNIGATLSKLAKGHSIEWVVHCHPLLLVRVMIRLERIQKKAKRAATHDRGTKTDVIRITPADEIGLNDPYLFNPKSDLMERIGALAYAEALENQPE